GGGAGRGLVRGGDDLEGMRQAEPGEPVPVPPEGTFAAALAEPHTRLREPADEVAAGRGHGPGGDDRVAPFRGHVVVVALEGAGRDPGAAGEGVQLLERDVADDVAPEPAVGGPDRGVDPDRHAPA